MKRLLFSVLAIIAALSTYDYGRTPGHYGLVVLLGVATTLLLFTKCME